MTIFNDEIFIGSHCNCNIFGTIFIFKVEVYGYGTIYFGLEKKCWYLKKVWEEFQINSKK